MAGFKLLASLSAVLLLFMVTGAVAEDYRVSCDHNSGGCDATTVTTLIDDLKGKVPDRQPMQYCNVLTSSWSGQQVYGYAYCTTSGRSNNDPVWECRNCLTNAGAALISRCGDTGAAGEVSGPRAWCFIKTGTSNCAHLIH